MRLAGIMMLAACGAVTQEARAELAVSPAALGQLEAVFEHCGRVNPASAERLKGFAKGLTGSATDKELAEVRGSSEYREAHDTAVEQLGKLPKDEAARSCAEGQQPAAR